MYNIYNKKTIYYAQNHYFISSSIDFFNVLTQF
uniref:Uncharacterized protein n=1 Tax=Myoviridae sp. ctqMr7 TaxID=2823552 RepID=A0A8S5LHW6_9CAUD|nr:MAG TPA: hypothetical protein [Myoviridae sp. ctqMr7]